jgi:hypothetical protein
MNQVGDFPKNKKGQALISEASSGSAGTTSQFCGSVL